MASPAHFEPASLKVFGIPELAISICAATQKRDNASLMRVCRQLFYCILPFVWEEVDEANALVSLIPGGGIVTYDYELLQYVVMKLPNSLELSRFNIYAPHVKRLTPSALCVDEYDGWEEFLSCTRSTHLLPNLETLYLPAIESMQHTDKYGNIEVDVVNWITVFLSASLQTLVLTPLGITDPVDHTYWLDFGQANNLMKSVSQKCPGLRSLNILPREANPGDLAWDTIVNLCKSKPLVARLHSLTISEPERFNFPSSNEWTTSLSDIIPLLSANQSSITSLIVRDEECPEFSDGVLECWRCLLLVNLELGWFVNRYNGFGTLSSVLRCLPLLEDLKLGSFEADFELEQLRSIVELLPNLRRIRALIKWETIIHLTSEDFRPCRSQSSRPLCIVSDFYLPEAQQEGAERLARYLSILRPSAPVVCESYQLCPYPSDDNSHYMINLELSRLRHG
ncbi:hypothetical protein OPQ81_003539 [Rhizoctonia solani]|nr:hypothetical protein OPQ81_003539 [Rhizoctonia solani]